MKGGLTQLGAAFLAAFIVGIGTVGWDPVVNNTIWLATSHQIVEPEQPSWLEVASLESHPVLRHHESPRAELALGILAAYQGQEQMALDHWRASSQPENLISLGQHLERQGKADLALLHYRGAGETRYTMGWFATGRLCQRQFAGLSRLTPSSQTTCRTLFQDNQDNLILNGQFETRTLDGWSDHTKSAIIHTDPTAPGALIEGRPGERWQGPYQYIALPAGTTVRFSADIRIVDVAPEKLRVLYVSRTTPEGKPAGNSLSLETVPPAGRTVHLEREFTLRAAQEDRYRFCPLLIDGEGTAIVDNVSLRIVAP